MLRASFWSAARSACNNVTFEMVTLRQLVQHAGPLTANAVSLADADLRALNSAPCKPHTQCVVDGMPCQGTLVRRDLGVVASRQRSLQPGQAAPAVTVGIVIHLPATIKLMTPVDAAVATAAAMNDSATAAVTPDPHLQQQAAVVANATGMLLSGLQRMAWQQSNVSEQRVAAANPSFGLFAQAWALVSTAAQAAALPAPAALFVPPGGSPTVTVQATIHPQASPSLHPRSHFAMLRQELTAAGKAAVALVVVLLVLAPCACVAGQYAHFRHVKARLAVIAAASAPFRLRGMPAQRSPLYRHERHHPAADSRSTPAPVVKPHLHSIPHNVLMPLAEQLIGIITQHASTASGSFAASRGAAVVQPAQHRTRPRMSFYAGSGSVARAGQTSQPVLLNAAAVPSSSNSHGAMSATQEHHQFQRLFQAVPRPAPKRATIAAAIADATNDLMSADAMDQCYQTADAALAGYVDARLRQQVMRMALRLAIDALAAVMAEARQAAVISAAAQEAQSSDTLAAFAQVDGDGGPVRRPKRQSVFEPLTAKAIAVKPQGRVSRMSLAPDASSNVRVTLANPLRAQTPAVALSGTLRAKAVAALAAAIQHCYYEMQLLISGRASGPASTETGTAAAQVLADDRAPGRRRVRYVLGASLGLEGSTERSSTAVVSVSATPIFVPMSAFSAHQLARLRQAIHHSLTTGTVTDQLTAPDGFDFAVVHVQPQADRGNTADFIADLATLGFSEFLRHRTHSMFHCGCCSTCCNRFKSARVDAALALMQAQAAALRRQAGLA